MCCCEVPLEQILPLEMLPKLHNMLGSSLFSSDISMPSMTLKSSLFYFYCVCIVIESLMSLGVGVCWAAPGCGHIHH